MENTTRMTSLTIRWLCRNHENEFFACKTIDDIKRIVWKYKLPVKNEDNWIKGVKQIDFEALLHWLLNYEISAN